MDPLALESRSGWTVYRLPVTASTNDVAARLATEGAGPRTLVLADRQTEGRGRKGRAFASPPGGLYVSLLLQVPPEDLPAGVVALVAVAVAEAVEEATSKRAQIKWPNDIWLEQRKVGGILLELSDPTHPVVAGVGLNLRSPPAGLRPEERAGITALEVVAGRAVERQALLEDMLLAVDRWQRRRSQDDGAEALEDAWRGRLALLGEDIVCTFAGGPLEGVLEDVSLQQGLLIRDALSGPVWRQAEHVQDLRPAGRTIS